jgi:hypothetical protein
MARADARGGMHACVGPMSISHAGVHACVGPMSISHAVVIRR